MDIYQVFRRSTASVRTVESVVLFPKWSFNAFDAKETLSYKKMTNLIRSLSILID